MHDPVDEPIGDSLRGVVLLQPGKRRALAARSCCENHAPPYLAGDIAAGELDSQKSTLSVTSTWNVRRSKSMRGSIQA
jgi:hypothetical protein